MVNKTQLPVTMRAVAMAGAGGPDVLQLQDRPLPALQDGEVLVRVRASGVNRPDLLQRAGKYAAPSGVVADIPGLEIAGDVVVGNDAWPAGTRVCALLAGGGYAEYAAVPMGQILPLPGHIPYEQGAALPECVFTVWANVFEAAQLQTGESILIHGGSSGIGTTAIPMIHALRQGEIFVTCGNDDKGRACVQLGATHAINYQTHDFVEAVLARTYGCGVDVVLDMVGGEYVPRNLDCLKPGGRHVSIAAQGGRTATIDIAMVMQKRLILTGSTLRPRAMDEKRRLRDAILHHVWPEVVSGAIKPVIHAVYDLADAATAHATLERGATIGKIVLIIQ